MATAYEPVKVSVGPLPLSKVDRAYQALRAMWLRRVDLHKLGTIDRFWPEDTNHG